VNERGQPPARGRPGSAEDASAAPRVALEPARGGVAELRIDIPPVNVLAARDLLEIARCLAVAGEARVIVLSGRPRAFSAGVEVAEHVPERPAIDAMLGAMRAALTALVATPAVTVASISGACLGGGAEIAAVCDVVLAAEDARIGFPEIRLACFPPGAAVFLPGRIGEARAAEWILTGAVFSGREAEAAGFVSRAVPAANLPRETTAFARSLARRSPSALAAVRGLLRRRRREVLERDLARAEEAYRTLEGSADLARAVRDFGRSPE